MTFDIMGSVIFKIKFLQCMLPVMLEPDIARLEKLAKSFLVGTVTVDEIRELDTLFNKFERKLPDAFTIPKI